MRKSLLAFQSKKIKWLVQVYCHSTLGNGPPGCMTIYERNIFFSSIIVPWGRNSHLFINIAIVPAIPRRNLADNMAGTSLPFLYSSPFFFFGGGGGSWWVKFFAHTVCGSVCKCNVRGCGVWVGICLSCVDL